MHHHYHRLSDKLSRHPVGAPKSKEFLEILQLLFKPDEVQVAVCLDFFPKAATAVAAEVGASEADIAARLETMAERGSILAKKTEGNIMYSLLPNYPGLFEYPLMKGMEPAVQKRLAELWHAYYMQDMAAELASAKPPWTRVFPAEEALANDDVEIIPYEQASHLMKSVRDIALANCPCRVIGQNCDKPLGVCLSFDGAARFLAERGMAKFISNEEALQVLKNSEEAGLVHVGSNISERVIFMCNCCPCCCHMLMLLTKHGYEEGFARSAYQVKLDQEVCNGCAVCVEDRCPVGVLTMVDDRAEAVITRCIGCGLCITTCPTGALQLTRREKHPSPPVTTR
ncbi:MAG TPA: 4Fe-4S binding protein, partial [Candidatus Limnocylindrales bacterium]|nr:4Fe-4S binding protein [Candidatus Limnocylindrales bacterium]